MAKGKYEKNVAVRHTKKQKLTLILSIVLILTLAVGGSLAYVIEKSASIQNQFERAYVTSMVNVNGDSIDVTNTGTVNAYIRAAIIVSWMDSNGDVRGIAPSSSDYSLGINSADWHRDPNTGFYYYKPIVAAGGTTNDLVTSITINGAVPDGYDLSVEVVAEAIQAEGDTDNRNIPAYQDAWGISSIGN